MKSQNLLSQKNRKQFLSYAVVGGTATAVEWILFWFFVYPLGWEQNLGFTVAYILSTFVNMILGRKLTFKNASVVHKGDSAIRNFLKETFLIYLVAAVGCVLNILLLNFFTSVFHMNSMLAKVVTTGIMVIANYMARKLGIYRESAPASNL